MPNRRFPLTLTFLTLTILMLGFFQNCAKFTSSVTTVGSVAGTSYCLSHPSDAACLTTTAGVCTFNGKTLANGQSVTAFLTSNGATCASEIRTCQTGVLSGSYSYATCSTSTTAQASCLFNGLTIANGQSTTAYLTSTAADCSIATQVQQRTCANGVLSGSFAYGSCTTQAANASCLFNGQTIAHGNSVVAFPASTVAYGAVCQSSLRTCYNGALSGTGDYANCAVSGPASCLFNGQTIASGASVSAYAAPTGTSCVATQRTCTNGALSGSGTFATCQVSAPVACSINGQTIASGATITLYASATSSPGGACAAEVRQCTNGVLTGSAAYPSCTVSTSASYPSFSMNGGDTKVSGDLTLAMQTDGNLVVYRGGIALWNSKTGGQCSGACVMQFQTSGNVVLFQSGQPYWQSYVDGQTNSSLVVSEFPPYISVRSSDGRTIWGGGTDLHWMTSLTVSRGFQGAPDFQNLFIAPDQWAQASSRINVIKLYSWQVMDFADVDLARMIQYMNSHYMSLAIEFGGVSSDNTCGHIEGYLNAIPDLTVANVSAKIQRLGGVLTYVVMDEPMFFAHYSPTVPGGVSCAYTPAVLGQNVAATMASFRTYFPAINAGDVEPFFQFPGDWQTEFGQFLDAFAAANGARFALYQDDDIYTDPRWPALVPKLMSLLSARHIPYGPIFNGTGSGADSDYHWTTAARAHIQTYHALGLPEPDQVVFQTWDIYPKALLPESSDTTIPALINYYFGDPLSRKNGPVPLYRFEVKGGGYLYSSQASDVGLLQAAGNVYDGISGYVYPTGDAATGLAPIYRLVYPSNNDHLLSISGDEIASAIALGYVNEGIIGYGFGPSDPHGVPFQNAVKAGYHFYTTSPAEAQSFGAVEPPRFGLVPF